MDSIKRQKIIKERLLGKSWKEIASDMNIKNPQTITNDRRRHPKLWDAAEGYVLGRLISICRGDIERGQRALLRLSGKPERLRELLEHTNKAAAAYALLSRLFPKQVEREIKEAKEWADTCERIENAFNSLD